LAVLSAAGANLSITNYWPIINGSFTDYVGGMSLTPMGSVASISDRFNNSNSSFETVSSSYAQAPAGTYFPGTSFSVTMWIKIPLAQSYSAVWDFGNGANSNNIFFSISTNGGVMSVFSGATPTSISQTSPFPMGSWMHLSATYNVSSLTSKIYVNGNQTQSSPSQAQLQNVTRLYNFFGHNSWGHSDDVLFDEIKFHGRVLTAQEVWNDMINNQSYISFV
jgi:hypothetical protein